MFFEQIFEEKLAQYAYIIGCQVSGEAIVIDPMRDIDRYKKVAEKNNLKIVAATETHVHADYLSGLREFADQGVKVYVSDEGGPDWRYEWAIGSNYDYVLLKDGDEFSLGNIRIKGIHTPGHTPEHMIFQITDGATTEEPMGIISGDFVFVGDVGRPGLLETAAGQAGAMESSARTLYKSIEKFKTMPEYLQLWPGHGAGSACGKALGAVPDSTVGYEQRFNGSIRAAISEQDFVDFILEGQPEPPLYFARMKRDNKVGPNVLGTITNPQKKSIKQIIDQLSISDSVLLDTRADRNAFMTAHIKGSLYAPFDKTFNTIAGSYVKDEQDIYLIVEDDQLEGAVLDLIRIGLDNIKGYATLADMNEYIASGAEISTTPNIDFKEVDRMMENGSAHILDVRKKTEYDLGHHPQAINIAHTRLLDHVDEVPVGGPVLVYCRTGARSAAASALLEREGVQAYYVNDLVEPWLEEREYVIAGK